MLKNLRLALREFEARRAYRRRLEQGFRIVKISFPNRIGHLCIEIDCLLKEAIMKGDDTKTLFLPDIGDGFANCHIVEYFKRYITIEPDPGVARFIENPVNAEEGIIETHPYAVAMYQSAKCYDVCARWGDRPPLFELTEEDRAAREVYLRSVGIPADAWYVCLHAREGGYSPADEAIHKFRSIDVESFSRAVSTIVDRGGWVVRMGDPTMRPLAPHPHIIDYAHSPAKSAQLDVALVGGCRFFLGSSSGLYCLAIIFGRPAFVAHMAPLGAGLGVAPHDLAVPQKLRDRDGRLMSLSEIMGDECSHFRLADEFAARGLVNEPNSPEEIDEAVLELLGRLEGTIEYSEDDRRRQAAFHALIKPDHYCYGASSSMGRDFLRRHMPIDEGIPSGVL